MGGKIEFFFGRGPRNQLKKVGPGAPRSAPGAASNSLPVVPMDAASEALHLGWGFPWRISLLSWQALPVFGYLIILYNNSIWSIWIYIYYESYLFRDFWLFSDRTSWKLWLWWFILIHWLSTFFPECVAFHLGVWGWGCVRQVLRFRSQPFATVGNRLRWRRKALHSGERVWSGPESVSSWVLAPQLYWCLQRQRRCLWEWSVSPQLYWSLQRRCLWEWSVSPQLYWRLQRRCLWEWSVSPQFFWCLQRRCLRDISVAPQLYWCQRRCLWEWAVSPYLYWCLQRRCLWERSVSPQLYWCLQRRCLCEWSVSPQLFWCLQRRCLCEWSVPPHLFCHVRVCLQECLESESSKSVK